MSKQSFKLPDPNPTGSVTPEEQAQLAKYRGPGQNVNSSLATAAELADALDEIPLFAGLSLGALIGGGGLEAGPWEDAKSAQQLVVMGAQPSETYYLHLKFPQAKTKDTHNVAGLLKSFSRGWEAGLSSLLSELGFDGNTYLQVFADIPEISKQIKAAGEELLGQFKAPAPPAPDPFAPPTGLQQTGAEARAEAWDRADARERADARADAASRFKRE